MADKLETLLTQASVSHPFGDAAREHKVLKLDLSAHNPALTGIDPANPAQFSVWINTQITLVKADYAAGGYGEDRALYRMSRLFDAGAAAAPRTLHLGIDLWANAGTPVQVVLGGHVHSFQDNATFGDYGPTVILEHHIAGITFFTLYGHLARKSLASLHVGLALSTGDALGWLGTAEENLGWPPHLHFQVIRELQGRSGDYPGVCATADAAQWLARCPNANLLLRIPALGEP